MPWSLVHCSGTPSADTSLVYDQLIGMVVWHIIIKILTILCVVQVKRENLSIVCDCAGEFALMLSATDVRAQLDTFRTIAQYYKMPLLLELIDFNLSNM